MNLLKFDPNLHKFLIKEPFSSAEFNHPKMGHLIILIENQKKIFRKMDEFVNRTIQLTTRGQVIIVSNSFSLLRTYQQHLAVGSSFWSYDIGGAIPQRKEQHFVPEEAAKNIHFYCTNQKCK